MLSNYDAKLQFESEAPELRQTLWKRSEQGVSGSGGDVINT